MYNPLTYNKPQDSESYSTTKKPSWTLFIVVVFSLLGLLRGVAKTATRAEKESIRIAEKQRAEEKFVLDSLSKKGMMEKEYLLEIYRTEPDRLRNWFVSYPESLRMQIWYEIFENLSAHSDEPLSGESLELFEFLDAANSEVQQDTVELTAK